MDNKFVSLIQLTNIIDYPSISEQFVRYSAGLISNHEYRHQEIEDISILLSCLELNIVECEDFIYGYVVPQLNKEFDLIKITNDYVLNIELKSQQKDLSKIERQLMQNIHYLKLLDKKIYCFSFVSSNKHLYKIENNKLCEATYEELKKLCIKKSVEKINLDDFFSPKNILVSPLNDPMRFINDDYLLTENQQKIKDKILSKASNLNSACFVGLSGAPGTGKTLLLYDLAKEFSKTKKVLIIHSGILSEGHSKLKTMIKNIKIISAKDLRDNEIINVDCILIDESQRLYDSALDKIENWVENTKTICIFSYDPNQRVSYSENNRDTVKKLDELCQNNKEKLTTTIRTNKEMIAFINCLKDLNEYKNNQKFNHVKLFFEPNKDRAVETAKRLSIDGYHYIAITPSFYNHDLDYQNSKENTHTVIGQEFDKVCMIMDSNFYYQDDKLKSKKHPNPDYISTKLLYQGLTRVRSELALIITDKNLLENIMTLFKED